MTSIEIRIMRNNFLDNIACVFAGICIFFIMTLLIIPSFCSPVIGQGIGMIILILAYITIVSIILCGIRVYLYLTDILKEAEKKGD